ncbi:hypothetical protein K438DRAFT_1928093 [Mycena galopus ATCC 62051]|nr:hypothetical protein K438DRAFT_1928093 [Mycena galopus ATCC 62051]
MSALFCETRVGNYKRVEGNSEVTATWNTAWRRRHRPAHYRISMLIMGKEGPGISLREDMCSTLVLTQREVVREARNQSSREKRAAKRKAEEILDTTDEEETEEETEGEDGSDFSFPDTLAPPPSTRSRLRAISVDSAARNAPTAAKRPRRVPARNNEDDETEHDFPASIPLPARPTRSRQSKVHSQSTNA